MAKFIHAINSLNAGELTPKLSRRDDLVKYQAGLRESMNFRPLVLGGSTFRDGTFFVDKCKFAGDVDVDYKAFIIIRDGASYQLELGDLYIRFFRDDDLIETTATVTGVTQANPGVVTTSSAHAYITGQIVTHTGIVGMTELNGLAVTITVLTTTTYDVGIDTTSFTAYSSGGTATSPVEVLSPYPSTTKKSEINVEQIDDIAYFTHKGHAPYKLTRVSGDTVWTFVEVDYNEFPQRNEDSRNSNVNINSSATAVDATTTLTATTSDVDATVANIFFQLHVGSVWRISHTATIKQVAIDIDATGTSDFLSVKGEYRFVTGNEWDATVEIERSNDGGTTVESINQFNSSNDVNYDEIFTQVDEALVRINITTFTAGQNLPTARLELVDIQKDGFVKITVVSSDSTNVATGTIISTIESTNTTARWSEAAWSDFRAWPSDATFFEQRLWYSQNQTIWGSAIKRIEDFRVSSLADSGVQFDIAESQKNNILWILNKSKAIIVGADSGIYTLTRGDLGESISAVNPPTIVLQTTYGASNAQPIFVNDALIYVSADSERLYELIFDIQTTQQIPSNLTRLSPHIGKNGIKELAFTQGEDIIIYGVLNNGQMLVMVYERKEQVNGVVRYETSVNQTDTYFSVVVTPFGGLDVPFFGVTRQKGTDYTNQNMLERQAFEIEQSTTSTVLTSVTVIKLQLCMVIDISASMTADLAAIQAAAADIVSGVEAKFTTVEYSLVVFGVESVGSIDRYEVKTNFTDSATFLTALAAVAVISAVDEEPGYDAIINSINDLTWETFVTTTAKNLVLFTDEASNNNTNTQASAINALDSRSVVFSYGFATFATYSDIVAATGGINFTDSSDFVDILVASIETTRDVTQFGNRTISRDIAIRTDSTVKGTADASTITGLDHLEGREIAVMAGGFYEGLKKVVNGAVTVTNPATNQHAGVLVNGRIRPVDLRLTLEDGSSRFKTFNIKRVIIDFHETAFGEYGISLKDSDLFAIPFTDIDFVMGEAQELLNQPAEPIVLDPLPGNSRNPGIFIVQREPFPMTVLSIATEYEINS